MKINLKKLVYFFSLITVFIACDQEEEVNYTPKVYAPTPALTVDTSNATDTSFDVNFTAQADGTVYFAIQRSNETAPNAESIIRENSGSLVNKNAKLTAGNAWSYSMTKNVYGAYEYSIYSVMTSVDGIASDVMKTDVTTPDTIAPTFDRDNTTPAHNVQPGTNSPFGTIDLAFSEPVFYQGGDVTFTGFFSGRTVTVSGASMFKTSGTTVSISDHGTFAPDDAILVTWGADTFKDNSGKSVAPLTGFGYYFWTRVFTIAEKAKLSPGMYNYSTVFYGGLNGFYAGQVAANPGVFLPDNGTFEITADPTNALTLRGINLFSGFIALGGVNESETLPIVYSATEADELDVMPNSPSIITVGGAATHWAHYSGSIFGIPFNSPGSYDFDAGTITHWVSLYRTVDNAKIDDIDYLYTRIGTYTRSKDAKTMSMDDLKQLSKSKKKISKNNFSGTLEFNN